MSKVPSQINLSEIAENAAAAEETVKVTAKMIGSVTKVVSQIDPKEIKGGEKTLATVGAMMKSYVGMLASIINTLSTVSPEGKTISDIVGKIESAEKQKDGSIKKTTEWTNLDALLQVSNVLQSLIKGITPNEQLAQANIFGRIKFKKNVKDTVDMAMYGFRLMIDELIKIGDTGVMKELLDVLVDSPELINETINHKDESKKMEKEELVKVYDTTTKVTKKGKVGLVTAMKGIFDLLKMMLELEAPGPLKLMMFKVKIKLFGVMLEMTIKEFAKILSDLGTDELLKQSVMACKTISGTGKEGEDGILGIVTSMLSIVEIVKDFPNTLIVTKKLDAIHKLFDKLINDLIGLFLDPKTMKPKEAIEKLLAKDFTTTLEKIQDQVQLITDVVSGLGNVAKEIIKGSLFAILAIPSMLMLTMFLYVFSWFVKILNKTLGDMDTEQMQVMEQGLSDVASLLRTLIKVELGLLAVAALSILAIPASILVILFIWSLTLFLFATKKAFDIIAQMINVDMKKDIHELVSVLFDIAKIAIAIVLMGVLIENTSIFKYMLTVGLFLLALIPFMFIVNLTFDVIAMVIDKDMKKDIRELALTLVSLLLIQGAIWLLSLFVPMTLAAMVTVALFFIALIAFVLILKLVLWVIDKLINKETKQNLIELTFILLLILVIEAVIWLIGTFAMQAIVAAIKAVIFLIVLIVFILVVKVVLMITDKLIGANAYQALLEVAIVILILFAIEILMLMMGAIAIDAMIGTLKALVFVIVLMVFVIILSVLLSLAQNLYALMASSIACLVIILIVIVLLLAIAALMVVIGNLWDSLNVGGLLGVLGTVIVALVMVAVIGVVALAAAVALPGLAIAMASIVLLLIVVALLLAIESIGLTDNVTTPIWASLSAIGALIAVGMAGLGCIVALAFMPMNIALVGMFFPVAYMLNQIANYDLTYSKVKHKIGVVKSSIAYIKSSFGGFSLNWRAKRKIRNAISDINSILSPVRPLVWKLKQIGNMEVDSANAIKNVALAFATVNFIEKKIQSMTEVPKTKSGRIDFRSFIRQRIEEQLKAAAAKGKLNRVDRILAQVYNITQKLNSIQELDLNSELIQKNLDTCFNVVDQIEKFIDEKTAIPASEQLDWWEMMKKSSEERMKTAAANGLFNRADKILATVHNITKSLHEISEIKISPTKVREKLDELFKIVEEIDAYMTSKIEVPADTSQMGFWERMVEEGKRRRQAEINSAIEAGKDAQLKNLTKMESVFKTVSSVTSALKDIMNTKISPQKTIDKVQKIFETVDAVYKEIDSKMSGTNWGDNEETIKKVCDELNTLNKSVGGLSSIDDKNVSNTKTLLRSYSDFLTKVDGVKFENLEKATQMFEHMASFSRSVNGNFEKLAQTINEDLITVLEELKKVMEEVPQAIEKSSASLSSSIGATNNNPMSADDTKAQLQRENPNMSPEELAKKTQERQQSQALNQTKSIASKLDKLISMMQNGQATIKIKS